MWPTCCDIKAIFLVSNQVGDKIKNILLEEEACKLSVILDPDSFQAKISMLVHSNNVQVWAGCAHFRPGCEPLSQVGLYRQIECGSRILST